MGYVAMSGEIYENSFFKPLLGLCLTVLNGGKINLYFCTLYSRPCSIFLRAQPCVLVKSCILQGCLLPIFEATCLNTSVGDLGGYDAANNAYRYSLLALHPAYIYL